MMLTRWLALICVLMAVPAVAESYGSPLEHRIWDLATGEEIERPELVERLSRAEVVLLGEVHDNPQAHLAQGALVRLLKPEALVVEMIATAKEAALNAYLADGGAPEGIGDQVDWVSSGWPDWSLYAPVFRGWVPGRIYSASLPRAEVRRSMTDGAAAILLAPSIREPLSEPLPEGRHRWRIPATFGGADGPDLEESAALTGVAPDAAIDEVCATSLRVLALGFAPGQPYLGFLPDHWNIPRRSDVTPEVPRGAVVVAVRQVIPFANAAPTGWRQIGRTAFRCYDPGLDPAIPLRAGDEVCFEPIDAGRLTRMIDAAPTRRGKSQR